MASRLETLVKQEIKDIIVPLAQRIIQAYQQDSYTYREAVRHYHEIRSNPNFTYADALTKADKIDPISNLLVGRIYQQIQWTNLARMQLDLGPLGAKTVFLDTYNRYYELDLDTKPFILSVTYYEYPPWYKLFSHPRKITLNTPIEVRS